MTDRKRYFDTREELRRLCRVTHRLTRAIEGLTKGQLESRQEMRVELRATRRSVYHLAADDRFWNARGVQQVQRNTFGIP